MPVSPLAASRALMSAADRFTLVVESNPGYGGQLIIGEVFWSFFIPVVTRRLSRHCHCLPSEEWRLGWTPQLVLIP